jgi:hypothetical protein
MSILRMQQTPTTEEHHNLVIHVQKQCLRNNNFDKQNTDCPEAHFSATGDNQLPIIGSVKSSISRTNTSTTNKTAQIKMNEQINLNTQNLRTQVQQLNQQRQHQSRQQLLANQSSNNINSSKLIRKLASNQ